MIQDIDVQPSRPLLVQPLDTMYQLVAPATHDIQTHVRHRQYFAKIGAQHITFEVETIRTLSLSAVHHADELAKTLEPRRRPGKFLA